MAMFKQRVMNDILKQAEGDDIVYSLILNMDGALLAFCGTGGDADGHITAAIARSIWSIYCKTGKLAFGSEKLDYVFLNCEDGKLCMTAIANALLCICAKPEAGLGMLRSKVEAIAEYLEEPMHYIAPLPSDS